MKRIVWILTLIMFTFRTYSTPNRPIEFLYKNRMHILYLLNNKKSLFANEHESKKENDYNGVFKQFVKKDISDWKLNEETILSTFISQTRSANRFLRARPYVSDSIWVQGLIYLLGYPDTRSKSEKLSKWDKMEIVGNVGVEKEAENWCRDALAFLTYHTYIIRIQQYSILIKEILQICKEPFDKKVELLSLCLLSEEEINKYKSKIEINNIDVPLWVKIRFGEASTEDGLIKQLYFIRPGNQQYKKAIYMINNCILSGSDSCLNSINRIFKIDIFNIIRDKKTGNSAYCISIADTLITSLARLYFDEPIFEEERFRIQSADAICKYKEQVKYMLSFKNWYNNKRKGKLEILKQPYLIKDCSQQGKYKENLCK